MTQNGAFYLLHLFSLYWCDYLHNLLFFYFLICCKFRVIEASYFDNNSNGNKRKRNDSFSRMTNPHELKRDDFPVGLKNVGNSCWFNAVMQVLLIMPSKYCIISLRYMHSMISVERFSSAYHRIKEMQYQLF